MDSKVVVLHRGASFTFQGQRFENGVPSSVSADTAERLHSTGAFTVRDEKPAKTAAADGTTGKPAKPSSGSAGKPVKGTK